MKPDPTSSSDDSLPPRRKSADSGKSGTEPGEADLWDFDGEGELKPYTPSVKKKERPTIVETDKRSEDEPAPTAIQISPRGGRRENAPFAAGEGKKKFSLTAKTEDANSTESAAEKSEIPLKPIGEEKIEEPVLKVVEEEPAPTPEPVVTLETPATVETPKTGFTPADKPSQKFQDPFDDLEPDDELSDPEIERPKAETSKRTAEPEPVVEQIIVPTLSSTPRKEIAAVPLNKSLSKVEKIGLVAFVLLLLAGGVFFMVNSINKLPEKVVALNESDFPQKGKLVQAVSAKTYWRAPITSGENADTFRRGTELLPILELETSSNAAAVRIFFKNETGALVGDGITRAVTGKTKLKIAATAGFDDLGMHAAYRAGNTEKWTVQVLEGPSVNASSNEFKSIFELPISTDRL